MVFNNSILLGAAGQGGAVAPFDSSLVGNSIWLEGKETSGDAMTRTWGTESNQDRWIWATWYQPLRVIDAVANRNNIFASGNASGGFYLRHNSTASTFNIFHRDNAGTEGAINTTESYRDLSSWIHVLVDYDSANANAENRISLYINGVRTGVNSGNRPGQNNHLNTNVSGQTARIGQDLSTTPNYHVQGYLAQTIFLDNKSIANGDLAITDFLDTFTFGTNGSQIVPKSNTDIIALASAAGNNSFCLDYSDSSNIVNDASSKGNNFTPTGGGSPTITSANQTIHTPSLQFPVLNALNGDATLVSSLSFGNRLAVGVSDWDSVFATKSMGSSGKYYYEVRMHTETASNGFIAGIHEENTTSKNWASFIGNTTSTYGLGYSLYTTGTAGFYTNGSVTAISGYTSALAAGDIVMMAVDLDNNKLYWGVNGTFFNSGDPANGTGASTTIQADTEYVFGLSPSATEDYFVNFGQDSTFGGATTAGGNTDANGVGNFKYTVPTGFQCLASSSLTAPDFQGIDYFDATLYEGNGTGQRVGDFVPFTDSYAVTNSVMFEDGDSRSLTLNSSATRTSATVAAFSLWTKRGNLGINARPLTVQVDGNNYFGIYYNTSDQLDFTINNGGATILQRITTRVFKDNSAWHNIVVIINQGESTQADRVKVFYDGVQIPNDSTGFGTNTCTLDGSSALNFLDSASAVHDVGGGSSTGFTQPYDGYVSEVAFLDGADSGAKLNGSDFGQVDTSTNRWVPKDIGSYNFGNTGYYLEFKVAPGTSNGAGTDTSGESNNFTSNGSWATTDQFTDTPSKNYPIVSTDTFGSATPTVTEGRLKVTGADNGGNPITMQPTSGKWYFEVELDTANAFYPGLVTAAGLAYTGAAPWSGQSFGFFYFTTNPNGAVGNAGTVVNGYNASGAMSSGDRLGIAWDVDNNLIYFGSASSGSTTFFSSGNPAAGTGAAPFDLPNERLYFVATHGGTDVSTYHFISSGWEGAAPTGFSELNQDNLDDTASKITAWAWIKNRDRAYPNAEDYVLVDRVRGIFKVIPSNETDAETTEPNTVQRFFQRGVQVGSETNVNRSGDSHVLWQWLLGDSATTGSTTSPAGSLASTSIVADAGHFAVISYTGNATSGATIGHGMSAAPEMLWVKERDNANGFIVSSTVIGFDKILRLDTTDDETGDAGAFNSTAPSATLITLGSNNGTNRSSGKMICYAFRSVPGVCKIGSYIGNGSTNGPYISTGFKPRWVIYRVIDSGTNAYSWTVVDTARSPINGPNSMVLHPNLDSADSSGSGNVIDIFSDGWKRRDSHASVNQSGKEYIYMAMADIGGNGTLPPIYGR